MSGRSWVVVMLVVLSMLVAGCQTPPTPAVLRVVVDQADQVLLVGTSVTLSATVDVVGGASSAVRWSVDDDAVVSVGSSGVVTAVAEGEAVVTATSAFDASKSDSVVVTVALDDAPVAPGTLEVRFGGLPAGVSSVLSVQASDGEGGVVRRDLVGPSGTVRIVLPAGTYSLRVGEVIAAGDVRGLFAVRSISARVVEVVESKTSSLDVEFARIGDVAENVRVVSGDDLRDLVSAEGSTLVFLEGAPALSGLTVGDVIVLDLDASVDRTALFGADAVAAASVSGTIGDAWDWLTNTAGDVARVVVNTTEGIVDGVSVFVVETLPATLANLVESELEWTYAEHISVVPLQLPSVDAEPWKHISGGATMRDVTIDVSLRGRRELVVGGLLTIPEQYQPLAIPGAECFLVATATGWVTAPVILSSCPTWFVVEEYDVNVTIGEYDLELSLDVPTEGLNLSWQQLLAHAKFVALVWSLDVDAGASMPALTLSARERLEYRSTYFNDGTGGVFGEPTATSLDVEVTLGDRHGALAPSLKGLVSLGVSLTDPTTVFQLFAKAGAGATITSSFGDPGAHRDVWPFTVDAIIEATAGARTVVPWSPKAEYLIETAPWRLWEWPVIGDSKLEFGTIPEGAIVRYQAWSTGVTGTVGSRYVLVEPDVRHDVWVEPDGAAVLVPDGVSCDVEEVVDGGLRVRLGALPIRGVCTISIAADGSGPSPSVAFTTIAAGNAHALALDADGNAWAWGAGGNGRLGNGVTSSQAAPVAVTMPSGVAFTSVAAGFEHSLALDVDGNAWAWGYGDFGQLGTGDGLDRLVPTRVSMPAGVAFTSVAAGGFHSLALDTTGAAWAWGYGEYGQLGNDGSALQLTPVRVSMPAGVSFTSVSGGLDHSLALDTSGAAWAWGFGFYGQLGVGDDDDRFVPNRVSMPGGVTFTSVSAGLDHSLALDTSGAAWAWGFGSDGQLGNGHGDHRDVPVSVSMPAGTAFSSLVAGNTHSLALDGAGNGWGWGSGDDGQLGHGGRGGRFAPVPVSMPAGRSFSTLAAGAAFSLALDGRADAWAWGRGADGRLGTGSVADQLLPDAVTMP